MFTPALAHALNEENAYSRFAVKLMRPIIANFDLPTLTRVCDPDPEPLFAPVSATDCYCAAVRLKTTMQHAAHLRWMALMRQAQ